MIKLSKLFLNIDMTLILFRKKFSYKYWDFYKKKNCFDIILAAAEKTVAGNIHIISLP